MSTSRNDFNKTWLFEMPQGLGPIETFDAIEYNIKDLLKVGLKPKLVQNNLFKIELTDTVYYFYLNDKEVVLGIELSKRPQGLVVNMLGKNPKYFKKPPYASELYDAILNDHKRSLRLLSDNDLSDDGVALWKKMISLGHKVSVYDKNNPGKSFKTFDKPEELDQYFKYDDSDFKRYQYILSESSSFVDTMSYFNTRRARELCGFTLED